MIARDRQDAFNRLAIADVMNRIYDVYRDNYESHNSWCSQQAVERAFLFALMSSIVGSKHVEHDPLSTLIASIQ